MPNKTTLLVVGGCLLFLFACRFAPGAASAAGTAPKSPASTASQARDASVPAGYVLVFSDEFNEPQLDRSKWWTRYIYNNGKLDTLNHESEVYRDNGNHVMTGNCLALTARIHNDVQPKFKYQSGMIRSKKTFLYGYFEARIKVPGGRGVFPAFWLNSDADASGHASWPPEIDIFEMGLNVRDDKPNMIHVGLSTSKKAPTRLLWADPRFKKNYYHAPFDFPAGFHTYGLLWTPDTCTFYLDGKPFAKYSYQWLHPWNGQLAPNAHILINLALGGAWAGRYGIDDSKFPQAVQVDWVRVYQKAGHTHIGTDKIGHDYKKG